MLGFKWSIFCLVVVAKGNVLFLSASCIRMAALPVGAAKAIVVSGCNSNNKMSSFAKVVVLPVPGPPVIMVKLFKSACNTAINCQSIRSASDKP